jgi:GntR family transcriptional regulator
MSIEEFVTKYHRPPTSGMTKYAELCGMLRDAIMAGYWPRGAKLPKEQDFAREMPYSLGTVQRALRSLVEDGLIVRRQGHGTFVTDTSALLDQPWHMRFICPDTGKILPTYTRAIDRRDVKKEGRWDGYFPDRKNVFVIERRFQIGEAFTVFNRFYGHKVTLKALYSLPLSKFDGANLKVLIDSKLGLPITKIEHFVALKTFDTTVCKAVGMARGSTVLLLEAVAYAGQQPVYFQEFFIPQNECYLDLPSSYPQALK